MSDRDANTFAGVGYSLEVSPDIERFRDQMRLVKQAGFTHVEVDPRPGYLWVGGRAMTPNLRLLCNVLDEFRDDLRFTLHGPYDINSFDRASAHIHRSLLDTAVDVAAAIGAEAVVVHPGRRTLALESDAAPMRDLLEREREWLREAGERLAGSGCVLALENWLPEKPDEYSYSFWPEQLRRQVELIDHPDVGVCLDIGHLFLSAQWLGFDFIDGVRHLSTHVRHIHLQDLFGLPASRGMPELGRGDLHLPPGWAAIPLEELFAEVAFPAHPVLIAELIPAAFLPHLEEIARTCEALAASRR